MRKNRPLISLLGDSAETLTEQAVDEQAVHADEGWAVLAGLLQSAAPRLDEAATARLVNERIAARTARSRTLRMALAASLLAAVGVSWGVAALSTSAVRRGGELAAVDQSTQREIDVLWRDELDTELSETQEHFRGVEQRWLSLPDPVALVRAQADALEWDLESSPL